MTDSLLLFYSLNCGHCRMLLDSIKRYDTTNIVKNICIETLMSENKLPEQIQSVPAMLVLSENKFLFGKQVFDYLLLPGAGKLVLEQKNTNNMTNANNVNNVNNANSVKNMNNNTSQNEPMGFSISLNGMSDGFSPIEDDETNIGNTDRVYNWTPLNNDDPVQELAFIDASKDVRTKKDLPSLSDLQEKRSLDLNRQELNPNISPVAISSR